MEAKSLRKKYFTYTRKMASGNRCIARQGLDALRYFKEQNLIHSDIKPTNCSYYGGRLTFFDFGLSFFPPKKWRTQTVAYRAPETLGRKTLLSYGVDLWAFAATLFAAYTCRALFLDLKGKVCSTKKDLYWAFLVHLGDPFVRYIGRLRWIDETLHLDSARQSPIEAQVAASPNGEFQAERYIDSWSEEKLFEEGQRYLQGMFQNGELEAEPPIPWRTILLEAAELRGEIGHARRILALLEPMFEVLPENRLTPQKGLDLLASFEGELALLPRFDPREDLAEECFDFEGPPSCYGNVQTAPARLQRTSSSVSTPSDS